MPLFWLDKNGAISERLANKFKGSVYFADHVAKDSRVVGYIVGALCAIGTIVLLYIGFPKYIRERIEAEGKHDLEAYSAM